MIYKAERIAPKIICSGKYETVRYVIENHGTHPECFIQVPKWSVIRGRDKDFINQTIKVHGRVTYLKYNRHKRFKTLPEGVVVMGWSYSQIGDYMGYYKKYNQEPNENMHRWTVKELQQEIYDVIKQLKGNRND